MVSLLYPINCIGIILATKNNRLKYSKRINPISVALTLTRFLITTERIVIKATYNLI